MDKENFALGIFVKTPGLSSIKTRLQKGLEKTKAEEFFLLSVKCIKSHIQKFIDINNADFYFFVAEEEALDHKLWNNEKTLYQGSGSLGERLNNIYNQLNKKYEKIVFLGGDSPLIDSSHLFDCLLQLEKSSFVFGPTYDGGFYLFAGKRPIPSNIWLNTQYSEASTMFDLKEKLEQLGEVSLISKLLDIDYLDDLLNLKQEIKVLEHDNSYSDLRNFLNKLSFP